METAKTRRNILQNQSSFAIDDCPEQFKYTQENILNVEINPHCTNRGRYNFSPPIVQPNVYNEQIINHQFTESPNMFSTSQLISINPMQLMPSTFNPGQWNITPQIYVAPPVNQPQPVTNNNFDYVFVSNTKETLTNRFKKHSEIQKIKHKQQLSSVSVEEKGEERQKKIKYSNMDLRFFLSMKRDKNNILQDIRRETIFEGREKTQQKDYEGVKYVNSEYSDTQQTDSNIILDTYTQRRSSCSLSQDLDDVDVVNDRHTSQRRRSCSISKDIDDSNIDNDMYPSQRRRSYSFSKYIDDVNDENDEYPSQRRRSCSLSEDLNDVNVVNNKYPSQRRRSGSISKEIDDVNVDNDTYPAQRRSFSLRKDINDVNVEDDTYTSKRRRSYSLSKDIHEVNVENDTNPSQRRSYSLSKDIDDVNVEEDTYPSQRRSYSLSKDIDDVNVEDDTYPSQRRSYSLSKDIDDFNVEDDTYPSQRRSYSLSKDIDDINVDNETYPSQRRIFSLNKDIDDINVHNIMYPLQRRSHSLSADKEDHDHNVEENITSCGYSNTSQINALRRLLNIKDHSGVWYIVADPNVLLYNVNLINILLASDIQCRLMVPQMVMDKINCAINSRLRIQAHRAALFIWQQVDVGLAEIAGTSDNDIMFCCEKLMELGHHVVLLTDDIELHNNQNESNIPMFTIREIKQLVNETKLKQTLTKKSGTVHPREINVENNRETQQNEISNVLQHDENIQQLYNKSPIRKSVNTVTNFTKVNDVSSKASGIQLKQYSLNDMSSQLKNFGKKKIVLHRHKAKSSPMLTDLQSKVDNNLISVGTSCDPTTTINALPGNETLACGSSSHNSTELVYKNGPQNYDRNSESVIIEETSNSSISNTLSNVDTGSERSMFQKNNLKNVGSTDSHVMFEVSNQRMKDYLQMKSDEWVSRFVQIMEEALTQVLNAEPKFVVDSMPPPWTIHEAIDAVKLKFHEDSDVIDAASKLHKISWSCGGARGKINPNINPYEFMELYSYGVYLIDVLQGILSNNEDLQIAAVSLSKLLSDIKESSVDDIIIQVKVEDGDTSKKVTASANKAPSTKLGRSPKKKNTNNTLTISPGKYNLRSQRKNNLEGNFIRKVDTESSFFSSLYLKKNVNNLTESEQVKSAIELGNQNKSDATNTVLQNNDEHVTEDMNFKMPNNETKAIVPKIIRNFTKCHEFEERLKKKKYEHKYDSWTQQSEHYKNVYSEEHLENELYSEHFEVGEKDGYSFENNMSCMDALQINQDTETEAVPFKHVMTKLESDIKKAYTTMQDFCVNSCERLHSSELSSVDKAAIITRSEKMHSHISEVCNVLNKILIREKSDKNLFELLNRKEFKNIAFEDHDIEEYSNFIKTCLKQGDILKEAVTLVLQAAKE